MPLKDALLNEQAKKREAEEAKRRPHDVAHGLLKGFYREIMDDQEVRNMIGGEVELLGDELQIDPGPILIRAWVDQAGDYHMSYEIKRADDPEIRKIDVKTISEIEAAVARLLVEYDDE